MGGFDLGTHTRPISTESNEAQRWFDRGLNWCFGFNHEEGVKCFERALEFDPTCAMAHWGLAYGRGPFYNYPWRHFGETELAIRTAQCHQHVLEATRLSETTTAVEKALIAAMARRIQQPHAVEPDQLDQWDSDYRDAMRDVSNRFPDDLDVAALFVEALITRTPWKLWDVKTGEPAEGADTLEALDVCRRAIDGAAQRGAPQHPALAHLHIHTLEMSDTPEDALGSANALSTMCPDAGHLQHMPGHIYVLCGQYEMARSASARAIAADDKFVDYAGPFNFYTTARCHDLHLMMYTCMLLGRFSEAIEAADRICEAVSPDILLQADGLPQLVATLEGYASMRMHVLVRFGRWADIIAAPMPDHPDLYCVSTAMHHYAKGVAYAASREFDSATHQLDALDSAIERIPSDRRFFNNAAREVMEVGRSMLAGELAYHQGDVDEAFEHLRSGVREDDDLAYTEPWAWMHPPRHALGALLLEQGHVTEAEAVYRADLGLDQTLQRCAQHPNNVWALHGLVECLTRRDAHEELAHYQGLLATALGQMDVPITSSCMCRTTP